MVCDHQGNALIVKDAAAEAGHGLPAFEKVFRRGEAKTENQFRFDQRDLFLKIRETGLDFVGLRLPVVRRTALEHVRNIDILPGKADGRKNLVEKLSGLSNERFPLGVFVGAGRLSHNHERCLRVADTEHEVGAGLPEAAFPAVVDHPPEFIQRPGVFPRLLPAPGFRALPAEECGSILVSCAGAFLSWHIGVLGNYIAGRRHCRDDGISEDLPFLQNETPEHLKRVHAHRSRHCVRCGKMPGGPVASRTAQGGGGM